MKYLYVYSDGSWLSSDEELQSHEKKVCATKIVGANGTFYYVLSHGSTLYDPLKAIERNYAQRDWKIAKTSENSWNLYTLYLGIEGGTIKDNKNYHKPMLLTQAERAL